MKNTLPRTACTYLGKNSKGKPLFLGKKESDNPDSRDLTLWFTVGTPRLDGSNYVRVSPDMELAYCQGGYSFDAWVAYLKEKLCAMAPQSA